MMATMKAAGRWCWPSVKGTLRLAGELTLAVGICAAVVLCAAVVVAMVKGFGG